MSQRPKRFPAYVCGVCVHYPLTKLQPTHTLSVTSRHIPRCEICTLPLNQLVRRAHNFPLRNNTRRDNDVCVWARAPRAHCVCVSHLMLAKHAQGGKQCQTGFLNGITFALAESASNENNHKHIYNSWPLFGMVIMQCTRAECEFVAGGGG